MSVAVSGGFAGPNSRDLLSAVTVSGAFVTTIVNEVVPTFASVSDTDTDTGYEAGEADTEPVTVHVRVPGSVDAPDVAVRPNESPPEPGRGRGQAGADGVGVARRDGRRRRDRAAVGHAHRPAAERVRHDRHRLDREVDEHAAGSWPVTAQ